MTRLTLALLLLLSLSCDDKDNIITPQEIIIKEITILEYPPNRPSGSPWDIDSYPDIVIRLEDRSGQFIDEVLETEVINNLEPDIETTINLDTLDIRLTNVTERYFWEFNDIDGGIIGHENMANNFNALYLGQTNVEETEIIFSASGVRLKFSVEYIYP